MSERREVPVNIPPFVLALFGGVATIGMGGFFVIVVLLAIATEAQITGPGEEVNRKIALAYLAAVRNGEPGPLAAPDQLWISNEGLAAVRASTTQSEYSNRGAYVDASHGTTCFA